MAMQQRGDVVPKVKCELRDVRLLPPKHNTYLVRSVDRIPGFKMYELPFFGILPIC